MKTWDVRLMADEGRLSLLVQAMTSEEARSQALLECCDHTNVRVEWCIEYPPTRNPRPTRARSDD